jgi:hypothetical protein
MDAVEDGDLTVEDGVASASTDVVEAVDHAGEDGAASTSVAFSSCTSSSSSESLRMMILSSLGGPRTSQLKSPKSLLVNSSSHETSAIRSPSSEDEERSTTGAFSEDPPCSHTGEWGQREETSYGDVSDGGDPDGAHNGVLAPSGARLPSLEGERAHMVLLLSSIDCKWRTRKVNPSHERKENCKMVISARQRRYL